jgi:hypothetical protein
VTLALISASPSDAHKPLQIGGTARGHSLETAQTIPDPAVSWVLYLEMRRPGQVDYFKFWGRAGAVVPIQLGVPKTPALQHFRPVAVVIGPGVQGMRATDSVMMPPGSGAATLRFASPRPETYYERFTRTTSWVTPWYRTPLAESGTYYVAVYDPAGGTGKYFLAVGEKEAFTFWDWLNFPRIVRDVRRFYQP